MTKLIYGTSDATFEVEAAEVIAHLKKRKFKHWEVNRAGTWESSAWERVQGAREGPDRALSVLFGYVEEATAASELLCAGVGVVHCRTCDERHAAQELQQKEWFVSAYPVGPDYAKGVDWYCRNGHHVLHITTESSSR